MKDFRKIARDAGLAQSAPDWHRDAEFLAWLHEFGVAELLSPVLLRGPDGRFAVAFMRSDIDHEHIDLLYACWKAALVQGMKEFKADLISFLESQV